MSDNRSAAQTMFGFPAQAIPLEGLTCPRSFQRCFLILVRSVSPLDDLGIRRPLLLAQSHTNPLTTEQELSTTYSAQVCLS